MPCRISIASVLTLILLAGCHKYQSLDTTKTVELKAQEVNTPIILDPVSATRALSVTVSCDTNCDAYLVIGPAEVATERLTNGQDPKPGDYHSKLGGTGGTASFDLAANQPFSLILRNPGSKPITAKVQFTSKSK